jgi:NADPH:quinone reductase-like Zn-dependent oxidoreductase
MKALVLKAKGQLPVYEDVADPDPKGKVLVTLKASALNHRDVWITRGLYPGLRFPIIPGSDGAGLMDGKPVLINPSHAWGENERYQGTSYRILGLPEDGTFAEQIAVHRDYLHEIPTHLSFEEAASLPLAGLTAYRALVSRAKVSTADRVFINGIGGGVAMFAFQFALAMGCKVYVSSGIERKIDKAIEMGAAGGINYKKGDWAKTLLEEAGSGFDVIIDGAGGQGFGNLIKIANPGARIAIYGGTMGAIEKLNTQQLFWKQLSILGSTMGSPADFKLMLDFVAKKEIHPVIDKVFDLADGSSGFTRMDEGQQLGKIVFSHA